nr:menaquinone biosynthesis protein [Evansella caseinilytica]
MSLVIGEISYTNILPLFYYIDRERLAQMGCQFVHKVPAQLNEGMAEGTVDLGGISSFAYGNNSNDYVLLPNLSVSSPKEVGSIFLFSKYPITQLNGKSIALTSSSATSVNLLKMILQKYYQFADVHYETAAPDFQEMMKRHDACLLIGDDAIMTSWHKPDNIHQYDLGALWHHFTGFPMTYAVFAVRKAAWEQHPQVLAELYHQLLHSKNTSLVNQYEEMIASIRLQLGGTKTFWKQYFSGLNHDLTERHLEGLRHYFDTAFELGFLLNKVEKMTLWSPTKHCHSV